MMRALLLGCLLVGCGDADPGTVRISAPGARWMAVRAAEGEPWVRVDGAEASFEPRGVYDVAVVCRDDIGDGWSLRATARDGAEHTHVCRYPGGVVPRFAVTGAADVVFVGSSATYLPDGNGSEIAPGTYDVVAEQIGDASARTTRIQVLRDVVVDGSAPIPIDIDALGVAPGALDLTIDGATPSSGYITGQTAGGTWFALFGGFSAVIPDALLRPGDRQTARLYHDDGWADVAVREGAVDVALPTAAFDVVYATDGGYPVATFTSPDDWNLATFRVSQWTSVGEYPPWWRIYVHGGALDADTAGGVTRVELVAPDIAGFGAGWMPDVTRAHRWSVMTERDRADGGKEGLVGGGAVQASTSR
jgi:hypothetical protein